jgi:hypothetical protein
MTSRNKSIDKERKKERNKERKKERDYNARAWGRELGQSGSFAISMCLEIWQ